MSAGTTYKRCPHGADCPDLARRRHGSWFYAIWLDTATGRKPLRRGGFPLQGDAEAALGKVRELVTLAGDDDSTRRQVGDMITGKTRRGGPLPDATTVKRRLGLGQDPGTSGATFGEAWGAWLAGKRQLRASARRRLEQIGEHWLLPALADVPLERYNGAHAAAVFERIHQINAELRRQDEAGETRTAPEGDVRKRPQIIGTASGHRVYAALREFGNFEVRKTRRLAYNPVFTVELEPETRPEAKRWTAAQAAVFLTASAGDPLGLMFRVILLRGPRRGEACGFRWSGADLDEGYLTVERPILQLGGTMVESRPKTATSGRLIWLDARTTALLRAHRTAQAAARLRAGSAWEDNDLVFARPDGSPWPPDYVSRRFREIAAAAGLPVIKLHEARHSAASLARDAQVDPEIRRKTLGHADARMTSFYTHVEAASYREAAEMVANLVDGAAR